MVTGQTGQYPSKVPPLLASCVAGLTSTLGDLCHLTLDFGPILHFSKWISLQNHFSLETCSCGAAPQAVCLEEGPCGAPGDTHSACWTLGSLVPGAIPLLPVVALGRVNQSQRPCVGWSALTAQEP